MSDYPECEKLKAVSERSQTVGEFMDWLFAQRVCLVTYEETRWHCGYCGYIPESQVKKSRGFGDNGCRECEYNDDMQDKPYVEYQSEGYYPFRHGGMTALLAEFFEIDMMKVDDERRAMIDECRRLNTEEDAKPEPRTIIKGQCSDGIHDGCGHK